MQAATQPVIRSQQVALKTSQQQPLVTDRALAEWQGLGNQASGKTLRSSSSAGVIDDSDLELVAELKQLASGDADRWSTRLAALCEGDLWS